MCFHTLFATKQLAQLLLVLFYHLTKIHSDFYIHEPKSVFNCVCSPDVFIMVHAVFGKKYVHLPLIVGMQVAYSFEGSSRTILFFLSLLMQCEPFKQMVQNLGLTQIFKKINNAPNPQKMLFFGPHSSKFSKRNYIFSLHSQKLVTYFGQILLFCLSGGGGLNN